MAQVIPQGKQQYLNNDGTLMNGGKLYTYAAGTTTPKVTYSDQAGTIPNTNPVILDARGEATIFWSGSYKAQLRDALDNIIWTVDGLVESTIEYRTTATGSIITPSGTTAQRDALPSQGYFRFNLDNNAFEGYYAAGWASFLYKVNGATIPADGNLLLKTVAGVSLLGAGDVAAITASSTTTLTNKSIDGNFNTITNVHLTTDITGVLGANNGGTGVAGTLTGIPKLNGAGAATLAVSGTDIKTVGSLSILGAGDIPLPSVLTGSISLWPLDTPPTNYLECDGSSLLRAGTYANLFAAIGTIYGAADGTHFNIPDYRGRFLRSWAHGSANDPDRATRTAVGATGATMTAGDHVGTQQPYGIEAHVHTNGLAIGAVGGSSAGQPSPASTNTGSYGGNETRPINMNIMYCIKY